MSTTEWTLAENVHGRVCVPDEVAYTYTAQRILAGGVHEPSTIDFILAHHRGRDIVHAGAGFGDFLPALGRHCTGTVWAFEPNRANFAAAMRTLELNGLESRVRLLSVGLGASAGTRHLRVREDGVALGPRSEIDDAGGDGTEPFEMRTLDELLPTQDVSIIHLDVEGFEFDIVDGARELIARCRPLVILEIDRRAVEYNRFMAGHGYAPVDQLIYNAGPMVFVNTVYGPGEGART